MIHDQLPQFSFVVKWIMRHISHIIRDVISTAMLVFYCGFY